MRIRALAYGKDNDLNIFGDFTTLEHSGLGWSLKGPGRVKFLDSDEVKLALENLFFQRAFEI